MSMPTWVLGEDLEDPNALDTYVVRLESPKLIARVTQKRDLKLMLSVRERPSGIGEPEWLSSLHAGARFWAEQTLQEDYTQPPEVLTRADLAIPRFLLCDNSKLDRTFVVHTAAPEFFAEICSPRIASESEVLLYGEHLTWQGKKGNQLVLYGTFDPANVPILREIATALGW